MQRYFAQSKCEEQFILTENDYHHIQTVMRMKEEQEIEVVFENNLYLCCIRYVNNNVHVLFKKTCTISKNLAPKITLVIPLVKEQKMDYILQKATELGVDQIIPLLMERSIIKLDKGQESKKRERWIKICKEASEQSKRVTIPEIECVRTMAELSSLSGIKLVCSTSFDTISIKNVLKNNRFCDRIICVIGPEGGISPKEEDTLHTLGFISVTLGNTIMRVETVPLYIMSVVNYEYME